jgi:hypothetical protein
VEWDERSRLITDEKLEKAELTGEEAPWRRLHENSMEEGLR